MATSYPGIDYANDALGRLGGNDVRDFARSLPGAQAGLIEKQKGESSDYLDRFRQAIMGQEGMSHMYRRIGDELNMPNLRTNAVNLQNQMTNLPETYSKATTGFDVNANQLNRIVGTKSAALAPAVETATNALNSARQQQGDMIGATQADQAKQLRPYETEQSFLTDRWAREQTGFTSANEQELNGLIAKMNAGVQLSEGEQQRINALAVAEKQFQASKYAADKQLEGVKYSADNSGGWG